MSTYEHIWNKWKIESYCKDTEILSKETETIKRNQMEMMELKNLVSKIIQ